MFEAITVRNLKKYYASGMRSRAIAALDGATFSVESGEIFGLLGANGAGKSTAIKIITGLARQSSGECLVFGRKPAREMRAQMGYMPESPYFYRFLTGFELTVFYAKLCGMKAAEARAAAMRALNTVGLDDAADRRVALYSKGMTQRAGLAQAIVHNPRLLVLDEPASGLDPVGADDLCNIILRLKGEGKTILLSSHIMGEIEKLCDRIAIMSRGTVAASGGTQELLEIKGGYDLSFSSDSPGRVLAAAESAGARGAKLSPAKIKLDEFFRSIAGK